MTRFLACCLLLFVVSVSSARDLDSFEPLRFQAGEGLLLQSTTTGGALLAREAAGPDTFDLYGGPRGLVRDPDGIPGNGDEYVEGRFESPDGATPAGLSASPGDWTGQDLTEIEMYWQVSTFNAENLNGNGVGNRAMWCGITADDPRAASWTDAPGYGNNWSERLIFEQVVSDPATGQTVDLDFFFNADTELDYDFVRVYFLTSTFVPQVVYEFSGTTSFAAPGTRFADVTTGSITYAGGDYYRGDRIRVAVEFRSDGAYSDEDGFDPSDGAIQVDDITITTSEGTFTEDFEGAGPYLFEPERQPFFGDFANVFTFTSDLDPCAQNTTPQLNFIDRGQAPPNGPGVTGIVSTGGETWEEWNYGTPGGYVLNWNSGISGPANLHLDNRAASPPIDWDLPGTDDDDPAFVGAKLAFDVWQHMPLKYPFYYTWQVRSKVAGVWERWRDYSLFNYGPTATYRRYEVDVTPLIEPGVEQVQVRLGAFDWSGAIFTPLPGSTPAPWFDNVRLSKYRVGGPSLTQSRSSVANDAFPVSGSLDASTQAARDALDVRFDRAGTLDSHAVVPGDSVVVSVEAVIPGTTVAQVRMHWALRQNPFFEAAIRQPPARPGVDVDFQSTVSPNGRTVWTGTVEMTNRIVGGTPTASWSADLPDEDFLYPGDVLHYVLEATDDQGNVASLPVDRTGFGVWDALGRSLFSRTYTVRALPTLTAAGETPDILWINDAGRRGHEEEWIRALEDLGLVEGRDFDSYTVQGASGGVGNGIGASGRMTSIGERRGHGASLEQLGTYSILLYESDDLANEVLGGGQLATGDPSEDIQLLTAWKSEPGLRASAWFGDGLVTSLVEESSTTGQTFAANVLSVGRVGDDLLQTAPGETNPHVVPTGDAPGFGFDFVAYGACPFQRRFDDIRATGTAVRSHGLRTEGGLVDDLAMAVLYDRLVNTDRKVDLTFPFGLETLRYVPEDLPGTATVSARSRLLEDVLTVFGQDFSLVDPVDAPSARRASLVVAPTPFNPSTIVEFALPHAGARATVKVFDVRGQLVRTLHDGAAASADLRLEWNGRDASGADVASGVYFVRAETVGFADTRKVALVK